MKKLLPGSLIVGVALLATPVLMAHKAAPPPISFTTWHMHDDYNNLSSWFIVGEDQDRDGDVDFMGFANSGGGNAQMFIDNGAAQGYTNPDGTPRLFPSAQDFNRQHARFWDGNGDGYFGYVVTDSDFGVAYRDRTAAGLDPAGEQQISIPAPAAGVGRTGLMSYLDTGDLDGDGTTDVVAIGSRFNANIRVFYNHGGTLVQGAVIAYPGGNWDGSGVRLADFDGDGRLDIVFTKLIDNGSPAAAYNVYRNNGDGTFTGFALPVTLSALGVAIGDANGDGKPDVFISAFGQPNPGNLDATIAGTGGVYLFTNTSSAGNISFAASHVAVTDSAHYIVALDAGDLNGDGYADMVYGVSNGDASASQHPEAWAGDGAGGFTLAWTDTGANVVADTMTIIQYNGHPAIAAGGYRGAYLFANFSTGAPPVVTVPGNITAEATSAAGAAVTFAASATDNDGSVPVTCAPASGSTFGLGATAVTCSATNATGNDSKSFTVTVVDTTAPALNLPGAMTVEAASASGATVAYSASAMDLVSGGVAVNCSPASGSAFAMGTTTVNCSATDGAGNSASGSFSVTVADHTAPTVTALLVNISRGGDDDSMQFFRVDLSSIDAVGVVSLSADLNGIRVTNGQIVQLQLKSGPQSAKREDGKLQIKASSFLLTATSTDAAGNTATATGTAVFNKNGKNGDDKKDEKKDDKDKKEDGKKDGKKG